MVEKTPAQAAEDRTLHVMPMHDLIGHETTLRCACNPAVEMVTNGEIWVHHALDGRPRG